MDKLPAGISPGVRGMLYKERVWREQAVGARLLNTAHCVYSLVSWIRYTCNMEQKQLVHGDYISSSYSLAIVLFGIIYTILLNV